VVVRDAQFSSELAAEFDRAFAVSQEIDPKQSRRSVQGAVRRGLVAWAAHVYLRIAGATGKY
jgi:cardiolipin synthase